MILAEREKNNKGESIHNRQNNRHPSIPFSKLAACLRQIATLTTLRNTNDQGSAAPNQNSQIVPKGWARPLPYKSPCQPFSVKRFQCSPTKKYSKKPGVRFSAIKNHGTVMASINNVPLIQGMRCQTRFHSCLIKVHNPAGMPTNINAIGPFAKIPMERPMKNK